MAVYLVDKPLHHTSFDAVAVARRALNTHRVGHTGTLDPLASGVLVIATDQSTKLVQFLTTDSKDYLALVSLGASTPTLDAEGPILETAPVPPLEPHAVQAALTALTGPLLQHPPAYSAISVGGVRAYQAARAGEALDLEPREVEVRRLGWLTSLPSMAAAGDLRFQPGVEGWVLADGGRAFDFPAPLGDFPTLVLSASVSSGTYLRSLARDLGAALGLPAHLGGLVRTRVGRFSLHDATPLEALAAARPVPDLEALDLPQLEVSPIQAKDVLDGKPLPSELTGLVALVQGGRLVAVSMGDGTRLKVRRAWA